MFRLHAFDCRCHRVAMTKFYFFLLFAVAVGALADTDSSEMENSMSTTREDREPNSGEVNKENISKSYQPRQRRPVKTDERESTRHKVLSSEQPEDAAIPHLGFSPDPGQSVYLSDRTGQYDVQLHGLQQRRPSHFHAALGAISAHLLNQRNHLDYVPYPPNGDPRNYPAYRGRPRGTVPPAVGAYERAGETNYEAPPATDFDRRSPSRLLSLEDYRRALPYRFHDSERSFYTDLWEQVRPELKPSSSFYDY